VTLDGLRYDFQAAGEFVLVRSPSGDLEIQARQEPWRQSKLVTLNTQLGFRLAGKRVTVEAGTPPVVKVGGAAVAPGASLAVGAGAVERAQDGETTLRWPDGSEAFVWSVGSYGVAIQIRLADGRRGAVRGLLGNFDGRQGNDLAGRGGQAVKYTVDTSGFSPEPKEEGTKAFFEALYDKVGESWRIEQRDSLLDYGPGQTTATFTDRSIPARYFDEEDLGDAARRRAEQICRERGVTDPGVLAGCILDVALTGQTEFADAAAREEELASVAWRKLAWGADRTGPLSIARTPDGSLHLAADERPGGTGAEHAVSVRLAPDGTEQAPVEIVPLDLQPHLAVHPSGALFATGSFIDLATGDDGFFGFTSGAPYTVWSPRQLVAQGGLTYIGEASSLFLADGTLIGLSPTNLARAQVYRGFADPTVLPTPFSAPIDDLPDCYSSYPALAADVAEVWLAWVQWDCPVVGYWVGRVDPAQIGTPNGIQAATRLKAPDSAWPGVLGGEETALLNGTERVALAGRPGQPGIFLAYPVKAGDQWRLLLWRVGAPGALEVARSANEPRAIQLAPEPTTGRLWVVWADLGRLRARRTTADASAFDGAARLVAPPEDTILQDALAWDVVAGDDRLDIVYGHARAGDRQGEVWHGVLTP
jgi:hypothetical protein